MLLIDVFMVKEPFMSLIFMNEQIFVVHGVEKQLKKRTLGFSLPQGPQQVIGKYFPFLDHGHQINELLTIKALFEQLDHQRHTNDPKPHTELLDLRKNMMLVGGRIVEGLKLEEVEQEVAERVFVQGLVVLGFWRKPFDKGFEYCAV